MDWYNQHRKKGYTTKSNPRVQCNSHQNPNDIHHRDWKIYPKVHLETQKTMNSLGNTQQKEQCWMYHSTWFQTILQSHSDKNIMVLAQKTDIKTNGIEQRTQIWSIQLCPPYFWQRCQKHMMENRQTLQQMLLGKVVICLQKTETRSMSITLY
jgi:hypothetical protein